jgi:hypothetical protein
MPTPIKRIAIFPKIQPDTVLAVFLLKKFGEVMFPGVAEAEVVFWSSTEPGKTPAQYEQEGTLLIDHAGSRFDHHRDDHGRKTECASSLVAKALGVTDKPELKKLLAWAKRDDLEGKGTISSDPLDRAFGLSGIIMTLNRTHADNPQNILDFVYAIFEAHFHDEWRRANELPAEWRKARAEGRATESMINSALGSLRLITLDSENVALPGFLRAYLKADVVIQRLPTGHINVITRQQKRVDLKPAVASIRRAEATATGFDISNLDQETLEKPGRVPGLDQWFYDTAANTIQNGGVNPQNIVPTALTLVQVTEALTRGLEPKNNQHPI